MAQKNFYADDNADTTTNERLTAAEADNVRLRDRLRKLANAALSALDNKASGSRGGRARSFENAWKYEALAAASPDDAKVNANGQIDVDGDWSGVIQCPKCGGPIVLTSTSTKKTCLRKGCSGTVTVKDNPVDVNAARAEGLGLAFNPTKAREAVAAVRARLDVDAYEADVAQ